MNILADLAFVIPFACGAVAVWLIWYNWTSLADGEPKEKALRNATTLMALAILLSSLADVLKMAALPAPLSAILFTALLVGLIAVIVTSISRMRRSVMHGSKLGYVVLVAAMVTAGSSVAADLPAAAQDCLSVVNAGQMV